MTSHGAREYAKLKDRLQNLGAAHLRAIESGLSEAVRLEGQIEDLRRKQIASLKKTEAALDKTQKAVEGAFPEDGTDEWFSQDEDGQDAVEQDAVDRRLDDIPELPTLIEIDDAESAIEELKAAIKDTVAFIKAVERL